MYFRRVKNLYNPALHNSGEPFKLSRSKIENFTRCPRCFYLDRRLGIDQPSMPAFTLNSAVDALLKKEFDIHRSAGTVHPLMKHYGIDAVPFAHPMMNEWRENFVGIQFFHRPSNFILTGAVDDIWKDKDGNLMVVDYKATSVNGDIDWNSEWKQAYRRQLEIYQWLLRNLGHKVSNTGYFVYANGRKDKEAFDGKLEFKVEIFPYQGNGDWIEPVIMEIRQCLNGSLPPINEKCEFCIYRKSAAEVENKTEWSKEVIIKKRSKKSAAKEPEPIHLI